MSLSPSTFKAFIKDTVVVVNTSVDYYITGTGGLCSGPEVVGEIF